MDLVNEASGSRVIIARHVGAEKAPVNREEAVNTTILCLSTDLPDMRTYFTALQVYGWVISVIGAVAVFLLAVLFSATLRAVLRHQPKHVGRIAIIVGAYVVVGCAFYTNLMIPRANLFGEAVAQASIMIAMYHLFWLIIEESGGIDQIIRRLNGGRLDSRVLPCCCWPCCIIPRPILQRSTLHKLHLLVLQLPVIQCLLYAALIVLWVEDEHLYQSTQLFFQPFVAASILCGVWGMVMLVRVAEAAGSRPRAKFIALQAALVAVKLQPGFIRMLLKMVTLPCRLPLTPTMYLNVIYNIIILLEMALLALWAWHIYKAVPVKPGSLVNVDRVQRVKVVGVLEDVTPSPKFFNEGRDNKSFASDNK